MDVTGSKEGTATNPKYSLRDWFLEVELPEFDVHMIDELSQATGRRHIVQYQWANAGPHQDHDLVDAIKDAFQEREWLFVPPTACSVCQFAMSMTCPSFQPCPSVYHSNKGCGLDPSLPTVSNFGILPSTAMIPLIKTSWPTKGYVSKV